MEPDCVPRFYEANVTQPRGTVVIWDGFTTCRQQSENLAEILHREGFNVIQPNHYGIAATKSFLFSMNRPEFWAMYDSKTDYAVQISMINQVLRELPRSKDHLVRYESTTYV